MQQSHIDGTDVVSLLVAGSACTDFSSYGNLQQSAGATTKYLLIMIRIVATWKPLLLLHENVLGFPLSLLLETLDELYEFEESVLQPQLAGFPIDRRRKYCIGRFRLKLKFLGLADAIANSKYQINHGILKQSTIIIFF